MTLSTKNMFSALIFYARCNRQALLSFINVLLSILEKYAVSRHKIHDMNIVATMIDNNIFHLLTYNLKDFKQISEIQLLL